MRRLLKKFTVYDFVIMAIMAALGIAIKPVVVPLAHLVSGPLMIPSGAFVGGLYMMWLVIGYGIVRKPGTGTLIALVQALLVIFTGIIGSHGIMSLFTYIMPGLVMDAVLLLMGHRCCCRTCALIAGIAANVTGTACVNVVFFQAPGLYLILILSVAAFSGAVGGFIAWELLRVLEKYHLIKNRQEEQKYFKHGRRITATLMCVILLAAGVTGTVNFLNTSKSVSAKTTGTTVAINFDREEVARVSQKELEEMPAIQKDIKLSSSSNDDVDGKYKGAALSYILKTKAPEILEQSKTILCVAADGYSSAFTPKEILEAENVIISYAVDGHALRDFDAGGIGPLRLVVLKDTYGTRSIKNIVRVECLP